MITSTNYQHGGNVHGIKRAYSLDNSPLIDFSANVNPLGISPRAKETIIQNVDIISEYPDSEYMNLKTSIASYCDSNTEFLLLGNGSTELITAYIHSINPKHTLIIGPTYSEYEKEILSLQGSYTYYALKEENNFAFSSEDFLSKLHPEIDLIIICNPNNPTGTLITPNQLTEILTFCQNKSLKILIDETYMEFSDLPVEYSAVSLVHKFSNLFVIRGISKFFSAPGLRFGYAFTSCPHTLQNINNKIGNWNVNSIADMAVPVMLKDTEYIVKTHQHVIDSKKMFYDNLKPLSSITIYESQSNFILCKIKKEGLSAKVLFEQSLRENMIIRNCSSFPFLDESYFRFCMMKKLDNEKLLSFLLQYFTE